MLGELELAARENTIVIGCAAGIPRRSWIEANS
jgi:hypothetical protein